MTNDRAILIFRMMASPIRLSILNLLLKNKNGICVSSIEELLSLPQSNVSQHLAHLRNCDILRCEKKGKRVCYRISDEDVMRILKNLNIKE